MSGRQVAARGAGTVPSRARLRHEEEDGPDGKNEGARAGRALRQVTGAGSRTAHQDEAGNVGSDAALERTNMTAQQDAGR